MRACTRVSTPDPLCSVRRATGPAAPGACHCRFAAEAAREGEAPGPSTFGVLRESVVRDRRIGTGAAGRRIVIFGWMWNK
jgi:hypothetical protein